MGQNMSKPWYPINQAPNKWPSRQLSWWTYQESWVMGRLSRPLSGDRWVEPLKQRRANSHVSIHVGQHRAFGEILRHLLSRRFLRKPRLDMSWSWWWGTRTGLKCLEFVIFYRAHPIDPIEPNVPNIGRYRLPLNTDWQVNVEPNHGVSCATARSIGAPLARDCEWTWLGWRHPTFVLVVDPYKQILIVTMPINLLLNHSQPFSAIHQPFSRNQQIPSWTINEPLLD